MEKKIGIVGWKTGDNSFGVTVPYMEFLSHYGYVQVLTPSNIIFKDLDLLVLPGGKDTSSSRYGQVPSFYNSDPDVMKEYFFDNNLKGYIDLGTPIFGICLGMQMLNVLFGGQLTQNCGHPYSEERQDKIHECVFDSYYSNIKNKLNIKKEFKVNSLHHQGINNTEDLAPGFRPMLTHGNIVEAFEHKTLPIAGVQYHPEEIYDIVSHYLISKLLDERTPAKAPTEPAREASLVEI